MLKAAEEKKNDGPQRLRHETRRGTCTLIKVADKSYSAKRKGEVLIFFRREFVATNESPLLS